MFRLFKGELKKILLKPSLFVITALLALVIAFSYYFYVPNGRTDTNVVIKGENVAEIYAKFSSGNDIYSKTDADSKMAMSLALINNYSKTVVENGEMSPKNELLYCIEQVNDYTTKWLNYYGQGEDKTQHIDITKLNDDTQDILDQISNLKTKYDNYSNLPNPILLQDAKTYSIIEQSIKEFEKKTSEALAMSNESGYELYNKFLRENNGSSIKLVFKYDITTTFEKIYDVALTSEFLESLRIDYYDKAVDRLNTINNEIQSINAKILGEKEQILQENKDKINEQISFYNATATQMYDILSTKVKLEISKDYSESEFVKFIKCDDFNRYKYNQTQIRQQFLFDNNYAEYQFAIPLSFSQVSNYKPNAYDFAFYVLELFSFLIIVFCVVLGSGMIAGEQKDGTLKLLAIRPYSRSKILFSKLLATMVFVLIFVLLSCAISMIAGSVLYGMESLPILLIIDASITIVVSPITALLIYLVTLILKIFVYIILAFTLSTIFRSHIVATTISVLCVFVTSLFGMFLSGANFFKYLPLNNLDLYKYFGGGYFLADTTNATTLVFSSPILQDTSFMFSFTNICITIALLLIITYQVFKRRDIA